MANGVRLATAYVSIEADVTSLEGQITDSLNKAGKQAKPAGEKIGKGINDGVKASTKNIGKDVAGDIINGIRQGAKDAGVDLDKELTKAAGRAGAKVGKTIHDAIEGSFAGPALKGLQDHMGQITDFTRGAADKIRDLNDALKDVNGTGLNMDGLKKGLDWLWNGDIGDVGPALTRLKDGLKGLTGSDIQTGLMTLSTVFDALGKSGTADQLRQVNDHASKIATNLSGAKDSINGFADSGKGLAGLNGKLQNTGGIISTISGTLQEILTINNQLADSFGWYHQLDKGIKDSPITRFFHPTSPKYDTTVPGAGPGAPATPGGLLDILTGAGPGASGAPAAPNPLVPSFGGGTRPRSLQDMLTGGGASAAPSGMVGPGRANESGLQVNTIKANRALSAAFPEIGTIGGVRQDALKWHPQGLALDVMIPGQGGLNDPTTPEGLALGNRIWAWMGAHAQELGIDMGASLWQQKDHYNHIHLATTGGGYPSFDEGTKDPLDQDLTGNLHKGEMVIPKKAVDNAGGGPGVAAALNGQGQGGDDQLMENFARTMGYLPAAANTGGVAGTSSLAGLFNLGNQAVSGLIDTGASAANMAISMAASAGAGAGTMGAGALAGPAASAAASYGIQLGANELKRLSSYGFQLGAIWSDALVEQMFPFGAPRWLGYDYTQFLPQLDISQIGTTTAEKAVQAAMGQGQGQGPGDVSGVTQPAAGSQQPGAPVSPMTLPGSQIPGPPTPGLGSVPPGGAPPSAPSAPPPPQAPPTSPGPFTPGQPSGSVLDAFRDQLGGAPAQPKTPLFGPTTGGGPAPPSFPGMLMPTTYDEGGMWPSGTLGMNMSGRPELVLSPSQIDELNAPAPTKHAGDNYTIYGLNADEVMREVDRKKRLNMMRYSGRPGP